MIHRLINRKSSIWEATVVLAVASLVSRLFGLVRDRTLAAHFGAGDTLDAYFAAFKVPDLIFNLLILGALSSAFIPVFTDYIKRNGKDEAWGIVNSLVNFGTVVLAGVLIIVGLFAPYLAQFVAPGFDAEAQTMVANLMRVMMFSPFFFGLSNLAGGILNSFRNFIAYAFAPVFYNLGIISGAVFLVPRFGYMGLAYGVVLGSFLHMIVQLPGVFALGYRYRMHINFKHPAMRRIAVLMIPRTLGVATQQISILINTIIASTLAVGSIAVLNLADNLYSLPISIFGISFAVAVFPTLAERYTLQQIDEFKQDFVQTFRQIMYFILPTTILYWILRAQIVRLVLGSGQFDWEDTRFTVSVLAFLTIGMTAQAIIPLLARSFYALQDTKTPFYTGLLAVVANVMLALVLIKYLKVVGLAAAISIASTLNAGILFALLSHRLKGLNMRTLAGMLTKVVISALVMGLVAYGILNAMSWIIDTHTFVGLLAQTVTAVITAGLTYLAMTKKFALPEVEMVMRPARLLLRRNK
ncbi:murein biosynthesis integral membrane protein MurJ [Patescibacteria group bacterium]|nr:murein biosynthesis integral membrane protein MurJ [Patescibacteria group bacterium]